MEELGYLIQAHYRLDDSGSIPPQGKYFFMCPDYGLSKRGAFLGGKVGRSMTLTIHPTYNRVGAIPAPPPSASIVCSGKALLYLPKHATDRGICTSDYIPAHA